MLENKFYKKMKKSFVIPILFVSLIQAKAITLLLNCENMNTQQKINEVKANIKLNEDLIDAIVNLQDAGLGTNALTAAQAEANSKITTLNDLLTVYES